MLTLAGPNATVYFANLSKSSAAFLANGLADTASSDSSAKSVATHVGARALMEQYMVPLDRVCLLDPKAEKELSPEDGDGAFDWFLFGVSKLLALSHGDTSSNWCIVGNIRQASRFVSS
jgi:hypothetical protein